MLEPRFLRWLLWINGCLPLLTLGWDAWQGQLGTNPVNQAIHLTGYLSLVFLTLALAITPLRWLTGWNSLILYRRTLGLFGFAYAVVHLAIYVVWDRAGNLSSTLHELTTRTYLQVGLASFGLMIPLAVTSTKAMVARLTPVRWRQLHRLAYPVTVLGVIHFWLLVKSDVREPRLFALIVGGLLAVRVVRWAWERKRRSPLTRSTPALTPRSPSPTDGARLPEHPL